MGLEGSYKPLETIKKCEICVYFFGERILAVTIFFKEPVTLTSLSTSESTGPCGVSEIARAETEIKGTQKIPSWTPCRGARSSYWADKSMTQFYKGSLD